VKLVADEPESAALEQHLAAARCIIATSRIARVEVARAVKLANPEPQAQVEVDRLLSSCMLVDVTPRLLAVARTLASASVRTLDAVHLASALRVEADEFVAYDRRLLLAASVGGLETWAPGAG